MFQKMEELILAVKNEGDTIGGIVQAIIEGVPAGLGEPVFDKLHAELGKAMLSINATKGFEIGSGFGSTDKKGSELNDEFTTLTSTKPIIPVAFRAEYPMECPYILR